MSGAPTPDDQGDIHPIARYLLWLDTKWARTLPMYLFGGLAIALLVYEFFVPRHAGGKYEEIFGFYEIEGFFGFSLAVLAGWPLRWLLSRKPDYYDQDGDDE